MDSKILNKVMILLQRKYNSVCEIEKTTNEIAEAMSRNDNVALEMTISMRGEAMIAAGRVDEQLEDIMEDMQDENDRQRLRLLLTNKSEIEPLNGEEERIIVIRKNIHSLLLKTIEVDKVINMKIGGDKSFYANK